MGGKCKKDSMRSRSSTKSIPLEMESLRTNLLVLRENRFFDTIKPRECVSEGIVYLWDRVCMSFEPFNVNTPSNDMVRNGVVCGNVEVLSMDV